MSERNLHSAWCSCRRCAPPHVGAARDRLIVQALIFGPLALALAAFTALLFTL